MVYQISEQKPAQLVLFDYYDPEQQVKTTYMAKQTRSLQDVCPECWPLADHNEKSSGIVPLRADASSTIITTKLHVTTMFALLS
ncbi:unnamed protein product [Litomosoides sigmodontis]|uniref:Alpha-macroglobulin receptor-binding domain-containing protein n=1 Tax=Litomosoides sigmodontis TaxID=42156 RepID=A0A3P7LZI9_LITSI|nr:unnamed protein product [Litomosoides sigmodontis]